MGWFNNASSDLSQGLQDAGSGIGGFLGGAGSGIGSIYGGITGALNNLLGSTKETTTTTNAPYKGAQSNSKIITIVVVILGVTVLAVAGYLIIKSSSKNK